MCRFNLFQEKQFFPESHSTFDVTDELFLEEQGTFRSFVVYSLENEPYEDDEHHHARRENIKPPEFETDKERKKVVALDKRILLLFHWPIFLFRPPKSSCSGNWKGTI